MIQVLSFPTYKNNSSGALSIQECQLITFYRWISNTKGKAHLIGFRVAMVRAK